MSNLDSILADDVARAFVSPDAMPGVESITYTPKNAAARTFNAQVFRNPPEGLERSTALACEIIIPNSATATVGVASVNQGQSGDSISLPENVGGTARTWYVVEVLSQDRGAWHLKLRS